MNRSFGLDLAGYSTNGSALAVAESDNARITVTLLDGHCFCQAAEGTVLVAQKAAEEVECLRRLLARGKVLVDVPIDLQDLLRPEGATFIWQLTKRPVDRAFGALCPLADRIGSYVARMKNLWRILGAEMTGDPLGATLFETYPAASLRLSDRCCEGYKGRCGFQAGVWTGSAAKTDIDQKKNNVFAKLLSELKWLAEDGFQMNNDEFDAAICALTGIGDQLHGVELETEINRQLDGKYCAPRGYVLLRHIPEAVNIVRKSFEKIL